MSAQARVFFDLLASGYPLVDGSLTLRNGGCALAVRSNSTALLEWLARYFSHVLVDDSDVEFTVVAIERETPQLDVEFVDWRREPAKPGRKDSYVDLQDGRLIRKVRTGMVFLQSERYRVAAGPCLANDNQVINFINAQWMNRLQQQGCLICHASGVVRDDRGLAIAGLSGGGKSTLMLRLLEEAGVRYLTNDRLFVQRDQHGVLGHGIPKLPRINPGTIVHSRRLQSLIPDRRREALLQLPVEELWALEDKHDVMIDAVYGNDRIVQQAPLVACIILNWRRDSDQPTRLDRVNLSDRRDLLGAIMKSPGPFYQNADGHFFADDAPLDAQRYLDVLDRTPVYEAKGCLDFESLVQEINRVGAWEHA